MLSFFWLCSVCSVPPTIFSAYIAKILLACALFILLFSGSNSLLCLYSAVFIGLCSLYITILWLKLPSPKTILAFALSTLLFSASKLPIQLCQYYYSLAQILLSASILAKTKAAMYREVYAHSVRGVLGRVALHGPGLPFRGGDHQVDQEQNLTFPKF